MRSPSDTVRIAQMQAAWIERRPVLLALRNPNDVAVSFIAEVPADGPLTPQPSTNTRSST